MSRPTEDINDFFSEIEAFDYKGHTLGATCATGGVASIAGPDALLARVSNATWTGTMDGAQLCTWPGDAEESREDVRVRLRTEAEAAFRNGKL
jgi:hypothetical protein